jgi:hypothetical protein
MAKAPKGPKGAELDDVEGGEGTAERDDGRRRAIDSLVNGASATTPGRSSYVSPASFHSIVRHRS